jgi:hypothetical protein
MGQNRVFLSQDTLDRWLTEERADVQGDVMTARPDGHRFQLKSAVHFLFEVAGGGDAARLVGKVKDHDQIAELGAEHVADSVILGDDAYQVVEGFVGMPLHETAVEAVPSGHDLAAATRRAVGDGGETPTGEIDLLARFFLSSKRPP